MKRVIIFVLLLTLTGCGMLSSEDAYNQKYCEEHPNDDGCLVDGVPVGSIDGVPNQTVDNDGTININTGDSSDKYTISINDDGTIDKPTPPIREGYQFNGWFEDSDFTIPFDFDAVVDETITLYAKYDMISSYDSSEDITIYKPLNDSLNDLILRILFRYGVPQEDFDAPYITSSTDIIDTVFSTTGNGLTYGFLNRGNQGYLSINDFYPTEENLISNDYAYMFRMESINRARWWIGDEDGDFIWEIPEEYAKQVAAGLQDFIRTKHAADIIRANGGIIYDSQNEWVTEYRFYDYVCGEYFSETMPTFKIGVAPRIESIARALVEGYHDVCPNFTPDIVVMETNEIYRRVQGDLSDGNTSTYLHFGFGDREFDIYDTEPVAGLTIDTVNLDAIAFYVNNDNPITNLTSTDLYNIFNGFYTKWDDIPE